MEDRQIKIAISGPTEAGKRRFIQTASGPANGSGQGGRTGSETQASATAARIQISEVGVKLVAIPGQDRLKQASQQLTNGFDGMIFLVDAANLADTVYAKMMLDYFLTYHKIPLLVCANKQDLTFALSPSDMRRALELPEEMFVMPLCALQKPEVMEAISALVKRVLTSKRR